MGKNFRVNHAIYERGFQPQSDVCSEICMLRPAWGNKNAYTFVHQLQSKKHNLGFTDVSIYNCLFYFQRKGWRDSIATL